MLSLSSLHVIRVCLSSCFIPWVAGIGLNQFPEVTVIISFFFFVIDAFVFCPWHSSVCSSLLGMLSAVCSLFGSFCFSFPTVYFFPQLSVSLLPFAPRCWGVSSTLLSLSAILPTLSSLLFLSREWIQFICLYALSNSCSYSVKFKRHYGKLKLISEWKNVWAKLDIHHGILMNCKKNEIMNSAGKCLKLEKNILRMETWAQNDRRHVFALVYGPWLQISFQFLSWNTSRS